MDIHSNSRTADVMGSTINSRIRAISNQPTHVLRGQRGDIVIIEPSVAGGPWARRCCRQVMEHGEVEIFHLMQQPVSKQRRRTYSVVYVACSM